MTIPTASLRGLVEGEIVPVFTETPGELRRRPVCLRRRTDPLGFAVIQHRCQERAIFTCGIVYGSVA